ncbi:hypothetical protein HU200_005472 [Digitaria exilis]|uniref:Uncharacterized protein n=1 Tax=Digitaria exilis TaxID=1010633 RepID=A0A835FRE1_9POAL|nr:hypothetical protein HU200_005472 [Digitaria exilis]
MSFLAGRIAAAKEGAFFLQESKTAVGRLAEKLPASASAPGGASAPPSPDVLPEILRHSVPIKGTPPPSETSLSASTGERRGRGPPPRRAQPAPFLRLAAASHLWPQKVSALSHCLIVSWQLPTEQPNYLASTANERRWDRNPPPMDPEKLKAIVTVGKAFLAATILVFGGGTAVDDVKTKGKDALQPRADMIKEHIAPLRSWAEEMSRKWHFEGDKEAKEKSVIIRELSRSLGSRSP